ncbi:hypothetical protein Bca4012_101265 [Brassica carinata]|uniref:HSF-type DNA-binding domain-containing protein n=1 Tax=Brassica carinata TaxID=52824 RepID=A0A8X7PMZ1_BRACI|nr:hypothetical protein Bca52824_083693 [Brassica carinata]
MVKSSDRVDSSSSSVAPFLRKCYEMVDDSSTDSIISWSTNGDNSFVISDTTVFSAQLLPKYFKHSNLSSFIRQLNIYGFRKVDADRCEFANDWFVRGQKELLKNVIRRKNVQSTSEHQSKTTTTDASQEKKSGESELWKEVDILKGDKKALAQELVKVRQYQESTDTKMLHLEDRVQGMEESQQEMLSFLVMVMQNPSLLVQLLQPKENNWRKAEGGGGGGAKILEEVTDEGETNSKGLPLVTYQKTPSEGAAKSSSNEINDFLRNADMLKFCLDENRVPLIIPDLYDDGAWEKLLLLSPSKKKKNKVQEKNVNDDVTLQEEDEDGGRMELDKSLALELIEEEMENADDFDFDIGQLTPERSKNLEILTQHMRLLASDQ